mgnify:FL=1
MNSFIAMNRFQVVSGYEKEFEAIWKNRNTYLGKVPGFQQFNLLKGPKLEGFTLYASHTQWDSESHFEGWTKSEAFRKAHEGAGSRGHLYMGHPHFEGFEVVKGTRVTST